MTCWPDTWPHNYNTFSWFLNGCFVKIPAPATRTAFWTSKSGPGSGCFTGFGFEITRATAWCKFCGAQLQKVTRGCQSLTILTCESLSRQFVWCKFCRHLVQPILRTRPFLGADFTSWRSHKTMEKHSILRNSYPPKPPHLTHLSCITFARSHLLVDRS